ncbi:MAG: DNA translocase FtsK 4TM domain-containing protein [Gammaproteobacteria bacterium]|nr:DNA translocase FtsK 4TM domain-containing protein [Gammaproteobacteria bacterium]
MKNATVNKPEVSPGTTSVIRRLIKEGNLIACLLLALFLLIALLSYSPNDPGYLTTGTGTGINNAVGTYGALLADVLLYIFGYLAYIFPVLLAVKALSSFRALEVEDGVFSWPLLILKSGGFMLLVLSASGLATLHFEIPDGTNYIAGGVLGSIIVDLLVPLLASLGSTLLLLAVFLFGLTITAAVSWLDIVDRLGQYALLLYGLLKSQIQRWAELHRQKQATKDRLEKRKKELDIQIRKDLERKPPTISPPKPALEQKSSRVEKEERQPELFENISIKQLPKITLLDAWTETNETGFSKESLEALSRLLELKLKEFGIDIEVSAVNPGPVITRFEVQPAPGVKASRITNLAKDLARSLAVVSVRIVEVIAGKTVIGIELPNENRKIIQLRQVLSSEEFDLAVSPLSMALGHDIVGKPVIVDLAKMPHLLVAGTTGSGKSVGINAMILSLLFKSTPEKVRLIMIDPKMLELSVYDDIPHLLTPVITDMKDAANGLRWCVGEMERRYKLMSALGVRNLSGFNKKVTEAKQNKQPILDPTFQPDPMIGEEEQIAPELEALPCIVVVVDELADMMMVVGKKVEELIARIAQKARAAGIHLILATQRPSVDVLTGLIKANVPTRLSFMVQSKVDSRTILGEGGAEQLLGHGDMLFLPPGGGVPTRVHGAFVSDEEVHRVVKDWKSRGKPEYIEAITSNQESSDEFGGSASVGEGGEGDELYDEAVRFVTESRKASISAVQRKLRIGYNRAARFIESMEAAGVVSGMNSNGSREVIAPAPPRD